MFRSVRYSLTFKFLSYEKEKSHKGEKYGGPIQTSKVPNALM